MPDIRSRGRDREGGINHSASRNLISTAIAGSYADDIMTDIKDQDLIVVHDGRRTADANLRDFQGKKMKRYESALTRGTGLLDDNGDEADAGLGGP